MSVGSTTGSPPDAGAAEPTTANGEISAPAADESPVSVKLETPQPLAERDDADAQSESDDEGPTCFCYDESGDLFLQAGPKSNRVEYQVCPRAIARASPVFKAKLDESPKPAPPTEPGVSADPWIVDISEDAPEEIHRFLAIAHASFVYVPSRMTIPKLYRFLNFLLKYDAMRIIRPWARKWLDGISNQLGEPWLLWVAWTIGDSALFRKVLSKIAENANITDDDITYGDPGTHWVPEGGEQSATTERRVPINALAGLSAADVIRLVRDSRKSLVTFELQLYRRTVQGMPRTEYTDARSRACIAALIGETIMRLDKYGMNLMAPVSDVASSYERTHRNLGRVLAERRLTVRSVSHCLKCPITMSTFVMNALPRTEAAAAGRWPFSMAQQNRLNARATETGLEIFKTKDGPLL